MPNSAKLVIGLLITGILLQAYFLFAHGTAFTGYLVRLVLLIALLTGLCSRQRAAWQAARWVSAFAVFCNAVILIFISIVTVTGTNRFFTNSVVANLVLASALFYLLGRENSRAYFHARRKA